MRETRELRRERIKHNRELIFTIYDLSKYIREDYSFAKT